MAPPCCNLGGEVIKQPLGAWQVKLLPQVRQALHLICMAEFFTNVNTHISYHNSICNVISNQDNTVPAVLRSCCGSRAVSVVPTSTHTTSWKFSCAALSAQTIQQSNFILHSHCKNGFLNKLPPVDDDAERPNSPCVQV